MRMAMKSKMILCLSLLMLVQTAADAKSITVPSSRSYQTIQSAIDASNSGDVIYLLPNGPGNPLYPVAYSGFGNVNLDFGTKNITLQGANFDPNNPDGNPIIDCGGMPSDFISGAAANRAFNFPAGNTSQVIGITIRNGYARGPAGAAGVYGFIGDRWLDYNDQSGQHFIAPWQPTLGAAGTDPCTLAPRALYGSNASGNGYGGAILCVNSNPTISYCVIENSTVTGAHGGKGADGLSGQWNHWTWADFNWEPGPSFHQLLGRLPGETARTIKQDNDGQMGGWGGMGAGYGYGGAIAIRGSSKPTINNCQFINNSAQGGQGGIGGRGGNAAGANYTNGLESPGGNAGDSNGSGFGGAIYAEVTSNPQINHCTFKGNIAKTGPRSDGGVRGFGNINNNTPDGSRVPAGLSSSVVFDANAPVGGAVYHMVSESDNITTFKDCNFIGNKAYAAFMFDPLFNITLYPTYPAGRAEDVSGYTVGGAIFCGKDSAIKIDTCNFTDNAGGAIYFGVNCNFEINNDYADSVGQPGRKNLFQGNIDPDASFSLGGSPRAFDAGSGGAIYITTGSYPAQISDAVFTQNRAGRNGGAIESERNINLTNCAFSGNMADGSGTSLAGFGGAVDVYDDLFGSTLSLTLTSCSFTGNESIWGGALSSDTFTASINNCFFTDNKAQLGGALDLENSASVVMIDGSVFSGNRVTQGSGGAIRSVNASTNIQNSEFFNNSTDGIYTYGGGISINGYSTVMAGNITHIIKNCLFAGNTSAYDGGAIICMGGANPQIQNCTFSRNTATELGGTILVESGVTATIKDSIIEKSNNAIQATSGSSATKQNCLFFDNTNTDTSGSNNLVSDPLFVTGVLGNYYLSQTPAQSINSPAVNSGSATALALGLNTRTTATNDALDSGQVDRGYHFHTFTDMPRVVLTKSVVGGMGTISASPAPLQDGTYYAGTVVTITAQPSVGWVIKNWTGTDDDSEVATTQKVAMNSDRRITVEFKQPTTLRVPSPQYPNITAAINDANDGDIIVVYPGIYYGPQIQFTKSVEIRSLYPDDPNWVAQTIIDFNSLTAAHAGSIIFFPQGVNSGCVLNGFTIRNSHWFTNIGLSSSAPGQNGEDGRNGQGGAIWIGPEAGPVIKNCVIRDNSLLGGFGGNGSGADTAHNAGRGGWGGWARGGAIYCGARSYPQFINCKILNNQVIGGFGGNGGAWAANGGSANYGGNWSRGNKGINYDPRDLSYETVPGDLWVVWTDMAPDIRPPLGASYAQADDYFQAQWGYVGDYRWYSGYGGGVFVNKSSNVTFTNCEITGNLAQGGFSGLGGTQPGAGADRPEPFPDKYEIPAFGGGVYVAAESKVTFDRCLINNNTASDPTFDHGAAIGSINGTLSGYLPTNYNRYNHFRITPYLGHGGGVCAEDTAIVTFINDCNISGNRASVGGGLYGSKAELTVSDCNVVSNRAYDGGGMFGQNGHTLVTRSQFANNTAPDDNNDINAIGLGGGLHFWSGNADIVDSTVTRNNAEGMGGGLYFGGEGPASLRNCLVTENSAGMHGGAVAVTTFAQLEVANCTIANNAANLGGGLSSSEGGFIDVVDTILWNNVASLGAAGSQIAVSGSSPPAGMQVRYSDIQGISTAVNAVDFVICFDTTSSMTEDIGVVRTAAGQIVNAIAAKFSSYRFALVDYRDYPVSPYGDPGDWPYRDRVRFTTSTDELINGLRPMVAAGGNDGPEAAYTALMHCIDANALAARLTANGNANFVDLNSPGPGAWRKGNDVMRVILLLTDAPPHDPEPFTNYTLSDITAAAGGINRVHVIPVQIRSNAGAEGGLNSIAAGTGGAFIQASDSNAVVGAVLNAINLLTKLPPPVFTDAGSTTNWDPVALVWSAGSHNINADPCFAFEGSYFLSQIAAGQDVNSLCVNAGSGDVTSPDINLAGYTTRTDSIPDSGIVDMGYHYSAFTPSMFHLTIIAGDGLTDANITPGSGDYTWFSKVQLRVNAIPRDGNQIVWSGTDNDKINDGNNSVRMTGNKTVTVSIGRDTCNLITEVVGDHGGTLTPASGTYPRNADVNLVATPDAGFRVYSWQGTNNDLSSARTNMVTMNGDKTVRVTFSLPRTITVPGDFGSIQAAISAARSGDIVSVASGVYHGSRITINSEITIASTNPDDPCVVAATIIDSSGYADPAVIFGAGATENTVFDGFTITSGTYNPIDRAAPVAPNKNGLDGISIAGGAMIINTGSSPTIRNCVVRDTTIRGGNASAGLGADATSAAGRGGWAGGSFGGGIFIDSGANPTFVNCTVRNCSAIGGNAANGGNSSGTVGGTDFSDANHGGSWSDANSFPYQLLISSTGLPYSSDYQFYSGLGGGVFCNAGSTATFIDCNITNNTASGGMSGIGGDRPFVRPEPVTAYRIPSYGGGVFCAGAQVHFIGCNITGNVSPKPDATYHVNPYLGHGGGIAFVYCDDARFDYCTISDNNSAVGGGMYWQGGAPDVNNCTFRRNSAYVGGGIYATNSSGLIRGCTLSNNFAGVSPGDVDVIAGQGGGMFGSSISMDIADCFLTNNTSSTSGGGIHIYGPAITDTIIRNCLLTNNQAGRDGGGISTNWGAVVSVENCTLFNNQATGAYGVSGSTGFGGGLYCSYDASTEIKNSIFWDNNGVFGKAIAEATGFEHEQRCGDVNISYCDISGGQASVYIGAGCTSTWGPGNINVDPLFVSEVGSGDFHLQHLSAGQSADSPCIDAGGESAASAGMFRYSTSTLGTPDAGIVDLGYHYPLATGDYCRRWDLFLDNDIDFRDLSVFAKTWVRNSGYDVNDLMEFTTCWLEPLVKDTTPPTPNPMTFTVLPHVLTSSSVAMRAHTADDASGGQVFYQFEEVNGPSSGWQTDPNYVATGLSPTGQHCFMVRAKDKYDNMTGWSDAFCVTDIGDVTAPAPAPIILPPPVPAQANSGGRDVNTQSSQFRWDFFQGDSDLWQKIVVDVTGVADNTTPTANLQVRFICNSNHTFDSSNVISAATLPGGIRIGQPVSIASRTLDGPGIKNGSYRLTWNSPTQIVYDVYLNTEAAGGIGSLSWKVGVYDTSGNVVYSTNVTIP